MGKHSVIVEFKAQPGKRDELLAVWRETLEDADMANPDIVQLIATLDDDDADVMRLIETYVEPEGFDRVMQSAEVGEFVTRAGPLLAGPPKAMRATPVWAKGIDLT